MLRSICDYLQIKIELDELDDRYAYAERALLHYAQWIADNEYPYLDKPDILEFATETWIGQTYAKAMCCTWLRFTSKGNSADNGKSAQNSFIVIAPRRCAHKQRGTGVDPWS